MMMQLLTQLLPLKQITLRLSHVLLLFTERLYHECLRTDRLRYYHYYLLVLTRPSAGQGGTVQDDH